MWMLSLSNRLTVKYVLGKTGRAEQRRKVKSGRGLTERGREEVRSRTASTCVLLGGALLAPPGVQSFSHIVFFFFKRRSGGQYAYGKYVLSYGCLAYSQSECMGSCLFHFQAGFQYTPPLLVPAGSDKYTLPCSF